MFQTWKLLEGWELPDESMVDLGTAFCFLTGLHGLTAVRERVPARGRFYGRHSKT